MLELTQMQYSAISNTKSNLAKVLSLRKAFYKDKNLYNDDELWGDNDDKSVHIVACNEDGAYIAAVTLVMETPLPVETFLNIDYFKKDTSLCEIKKLVISDGVGLQKKDILIQLLREMCRQIISRHIDRMIIAVSERMKRNLTPYRNVGFEKLGSYYHPMLGETTVESLDFRKAEKGVFSVEKLQQALQQRLVDSSGSNSNYGQ